jgi:glycosyltransferase involved in cell wall biosynthesis
MIAAPQLSVIIPVFNMERYIGECLSSIFKVKEFTMEVIVIDDGSTDDTNVVLKSFTDPRLRVISTPNRGPSAARNVGFASSRAKFILPFDADDIAVVENWRSILVTMAANPDAVLVYGERRGFEGIDNDFPRLPSGERYPADAEVIPLIFTRNFMQMGAAFIRRDAIAAAGLWNENLRVGEDWDLWCRLACLGRFIFCPVLVMGYRLHDQSAMGSPVLRNVRDPALAAIDAIYSSPMVKLRIGHDHRKLKRKALAWQSYHWGTRLIRNGAVWPGAKAILWAISRDPSHFIHLCAYPRRRLRRLMAVIKPRCAWLGIINLMAASIGLECEMNAA